MDLTPPERRTPKDWAVAGLVVACFILLILVNHYRTRAIMLELDLDDAEQTIEYYMTKFPGDDPDLPLIRTRVEFDALPPGTSFVGTDGIRYFKPYPTNSTTDPNPQK